jgi:probable phosphoglycerate mutase
MTTIALVRHGDNDFITKGLAGRTPNIHLNSIGIQQANELAQTLSAAPIEAIYSSPLERAIETAQPLADLKGLPIQIEPGIIEIDFGDYMGKPWKWLYQQPYWLQ